MRRTLKISLSIMIALMLVMGSGSSLLNAQTTNSPSARVGAIQGDAETALGRDQDYVKLSRGSTVSPWNMIRTNQNSKLLLNWENGIASSLGEFSSLFLSSKEGQRGLVDNYEIVEGVVRILNEGSRAPRTGPFAVDTPIATIEPDNLDALVDFIVEVYSPESTIVTVISGDIRVTNTSVQQPLQKIVTSCQSVYLQQGKQAFEVLPTNTENLKRLVDLSTIPGTIMAALDTCPIAEVAPPRQERIVRAAPEYYFIEDWEAYDIYPWEEIVVLPPYEWPPDGVVILLPGIGRWIIPFAVFGGWKIDPVILPVYVKYVILDRVLYWDHYHLADLRFRHRNLNDLIYLAQLTGNRKMLLDAQRQLAGLNVQIDWANKRINKLQHKIGALEQEQKRIAPKLPSGVNLVNNISNAFNSPKNLQVVENFRNKIKNEIGVQTQLANLAGKELTDLRSKIAHERDPQKRLALREELTKLRSDVVQGKLPVPKDQPQLRDVVGKLVKEQDPKQLERVQKQLSQFTSVDRHAEILSPDKLTNIKKELANFPNPQKREELQSRVSELQQSIDARKQAELNLERIDSITAKAASEKSPERRQELINQLQQLVKPAPGLPGQLGLLGQRQQIESQLALEQDQRKRAELQKQLDEQRRKQAEIMRQQLVRPPEDLHKPPTDVQKQMERAREEEQRRRETDQARQLLEQRRQQQAEQMRQQQLRQQQLEQQQQAEHLQRQKLEAEKLRKQQEAETRRQAEQQMRQQQQAEQLKRQQQQAEQIRRQQQEQAEQMRRRQEQAEQTRRQQQVEQMRQQQIRQQQLEQQQQMRLQQQQAEQMRRQQEQVEQQRRQQQQAEQMRQQQLRQQQHEQMRQQQMEQQQMRLHQQQAEQMRRQQEQAEQMRRQQQLQQQQMRFQQMQQQQQMRQQQALQQQEEMRRKGSQAPIPGIMGR